MASGEDPQGRHGTVPSPQSWRGGNGPGGVPDMSLDLQLSELRRSLDVATTKIDGQLAVLLQKSDYADQRVRESAERVAAELAARDARLFSHEKIMEEQDKRTDQVERRLYFLAGIAATIGSVAGIVTSIALHGH